MNFKLAFILFIVLLSSCKTIPCIDSNPILNFVSFSGRETDSIILRKYLKNTNFNSVVDSTIISTTNSDYQNSNDTLHILNSLGGDYGLDIQFDYEVYLPFANRVFQLSNFEEQQTEMNAGISLDKQQCINPIKSYTLNGQVVNGKPDYHIIYLSK